MPKVTQLLYVTELEFKPRLIPEPTLIHANITALSLHLPAGETVASKVTSLASPVRVWRS